MIYDPRPVFDIRLAIFAGLYRAAVKAAQDFIAQENKPWEYYLGMAFGGTALATGGIGAVATIYAVGESVDLLLFHSPDGSSVDLFLDGVLHSTVDLFVDTSPDWFTKSITGLTPGILHRIDIVNNVNTNPAKTSPINWLGIGTVTVNGEGAYIQERSGIMSLYNISYSILDGDGDVDTVAVKVIAASHTIAQVQEAAQDLAALIDPIIDGKITGIAITLEASLPGGLKASPVAGSENQRGALFSFNLDGSPYRYSVRLPAFKESLFAGKSVDVEDADVDAFVDAMTGGIAVDAGGGATVEPANPFEFELASLANAVKSFRK